MLFFFLGPDNFSKDSQISSLAKKHKAEAEFFVSAEERPQLSGLFGQDLFSKTKVVVLQNLLAGYDYNQEIADKLVVGKNVIVFEEDKVDKRLSNNKQWLAHKGAEVKQFDLPHGADLDKWITSRAKELNSTISKGAAAFLAKKLGRDDAKEIRAGGPFGKAQGRPEQSRGGGKLIAGEEIYSLWQADSEIRKLIAYANGQEIKEADVNNLVSENGEVDVFKIINAIGDHNKQAALELIGKFLSEGDTKAQIIQLNALLSEQFRNIYALSDLLARKISDDKILSLTAWKSGRLYVLKKIAGRFKPDIVKQTLNKLAALDKELKTTSTPPRVLLDLILAQLFI